MEHNIVVGHYSSNSYGLPKVTAKIPMPTSCKPPKEDDPVNKPKHYQYSPIQPVDVVNAWDLDFYLGNVIKYISRFNHKGNPLEDIKKARWYLDKKIEEMEKKCTT
jgi:hypothetical protein